MPNRNPSSENPLKNSAEATAPRATTRVRDQEDAITDMAGAGADTVNQGRDAAADGLESTASAVRASAERLPGGPKIQEFAHATADRLSSTADYMRTHDAARMVADLGGWVKHNPGPALVVAAAFGFLVGRALSRD